MSYQFTASLVYSSTPESQQVPELSKSRFCQKLSVPPAAVPVNGSAVGTGVAMLVASW